MSIKGVGGRRQYDYLKECKAMAQVAGMVILPEVKISKPRKKRAKETKPRNQPEAELRKAVIKEIRKRGGKVWRVESALSAYKGLPDLCFFINNKFYWCELKAQKHTWYEEQIEFKELCISSGTNYIIVMSVEDLKII